MKTIPVVDDERNVAVVRLYLEKERIAVVSAAAGEATLAMLNRHDPDRVVLDLMRPRLDGFEVCREIRGRGPMPILTHPTFGGRTLELRAREFGLLVALARDPGVVLTRDALLDPHGARVAVRLSSVLGSASAVRGAAGDPPTAPA